MCLNKKEHTITYLLATVFIAVALCSALYLSLGKIFNLTFNQKDFEDYFKKSYNLELKLQNLNVKATGNLHAVLSADAVSVVDPSLEKELLSAEDVRLGVEIPPLIFRKVYLSNVEASRLNAYIVRDKKGVFNFEKYFKDKGSYDINLSRTHLSIKKYTFLFDDYALNNKLMLEGKSLLSNGFNKDKRINLSTAGQLIFEQRKVNGLKNTSTYDIDVNARLPFYKYASNSDFKLNALVTNLRLDPYSDYVKHFVCPGLNSSSGLINFELSSSKPSAPLAFEARLNDIKLNFIEDKKHSTIKALGTSKVNAAFDFESETALNILNFSYLAKGLNFELKGRVFDYAKKKKPSLSLEASIKDSDARVIAELLPDFIKTPEDSIRKIKLHKLNGLVNGKLRIVGESKRPKLYGKINFSKVFFGEKDLKTHLGAGFCEFDADTLAVNVRVFLTQGQYVDVIGLTELFSKSKPVANFNIISSKRVDAKLALDTTLKVKDILGFQLGPLPMMKLGGYGELSLETKGTKDKATVKGFANLYDASASFNGINALATNVNGKILFKGQDIVYNGIKARIEGAPSRIDGQASTDGKVDITFNISNIKLADGLKVVQTSTLIKDELKGIELIKSISGNGNIKLNLNGVMKNISNLDLAMLTKKPGGKTKGPLEPTLRIDFFNSKLVSEPNIEVKDLAGTLHYSKLFKLDFSGKLYNSAFNLAGTVEPLNNAQKVDLNFSSNDFKLADYIDFLTVGLESPFNKVELSRLAAAKKLNLSFVTKINAKGSAIVSGRQIDLRGIQLSGSANGVNSASSLIKFHSGNVKFKGQKVILDNLRFTLWGAHMLAQGSVDEIFNKKQILNIKTTLRGFNLARLNQNRENLPPSVKKLLSGYENFKGVITGKVDIANNKVGGELFFADVSAYNKLKKALLELKSGSVKMSGDKLNLKALNIVFGDTPIYLDASVVNVNSKDPYFDATFSTNLTESAVDSLINPSLTYPVKLKGELIVKGSIRGYLDNYNTTGAIVLSPQTDISYMGASLGDADAKRELRFNASFKGSSARIHNLEYLKYLYSQNNKQNALSIIRASGNVSIVNKMPYLNNFAIRTQNGAPAGLFNMIFRKSILKQGNFTCNLNINGTLLTPKVLGDIAFSDIDIPLYSARIKDADFNLKNDVITGKLSGRGLDSDIRIDTQIKNSTALPVVFKSLQIESKKVSLDKILEELTFVASMQKNPSITSGNPNQSFVFNPKDVIIENGVFKGDDVVLNKIKAKNFSTKFYQGHDAIFRVEDLTFDIAGGKILSKGSFEFDKSKLDMRSQIIDCDANILSDSFLGISNQLYGRMNGVIDLSGSQLHTAKGLETISAKAQFEVKKGKMPKLGSLEYLLRAGNFLKSGLLGLTLNNIIDVIVPYKTGEFDSIKGNLVAENGKVNSLEIYSKGENLSLFAHGTYDLTTNNADIEILGRLSKKVSSLLGPVGNASINSLLNVLSGQKMSEFAKNELVQNINKVPLIELSGEDVRIFVVKVLGDLNKEGYVKSFYWAD